MRTKIFIDAGPLVALFNTNDQYHTWVHRELREFPALITTEPVLAECCYLIRKKAGDALLPLKLIESSELQLELRVGKEISPLLNLMRKYRDVPMSLADATLVRLSELYSDCKIVTLDSDFKIYRRNVRHVIPLISPFS